MQIEDMKLRNHKKNFPGNTIVIIFRIAVSKHTSLNYRTPAVFELIR